MVIPLGFKESLGSIVHYLRGIELFKNLFHKIEKKVESFIRNFGLLFLNLGLRHSSIPLQCINVLFQLRFNILSNIYFPLLRHYISHHHGLLYSTLGFNWRIIYVLEQYKELYTHEVKETDIYSYYH